MQPSKMHLNENHFSSEQDIADHFAKYNTETICVLFDVLGPQNINLLTFNIPISIIFYKLNELNPEQWFGHDSVPHYNLKYCSIVLSRPLSFIASPYNINYGPIFILRAISEAFKRFHL